MMQKVLHETCQQYVDRRLSEGWKIVWQQGYHLILSSPDGIRRELDLRNDVETLRPNDVGDETGIPEQYPDSTYHWDKVDEESRDEDTTYVRAYGLAYQRDLYNLPSHSVGSGTINSITIYFRIRIETGGVYSKAVQKSGTTVTEGSPRYEGGEGWKTKDQTFTTNPATGSAYTWEEIDALQIGVALASYSTDNYIRCTQVYVEVDYTALGSESKSAGMAAKMVAARAI